MRVLVGSCGTCTCWLQLQRMAIQWLRSGRYGLRGRALSHSVRGESHGRCRKTVQASLHREGFGRPGRRRSFCLCCRCLLRLCPSCCFRLRFRRFPCRCSSCRFRPYSSCELRTVLSGSRCPVQPHAAEALQLLLGQVLVPRTLAGGWSSVSCGTSRCGGRMSAVAPRLRIRKDSGRCRSRRVRNGQRMPHVAGGCALLRAVLPWSI